MAACFIFLIIVTPVGANVWTKWHNITVKDMDQEAFTELQADSTPRLDLEAYPDYLNTYPQVSLDEAMEMASFEILRPKDFQMPTELSTGTLENKGFKKTEFGAYWDVFHEDDKWIYVRQDLYDHSGQVLDEDAIETVWRIPPGDEVLSFQEDAMAVVSELEEDGVLINMVVRNDENQVIGFEMRGNVSKEKMIELAKSYLQ